MRRHQNSDVKKVFIEVVTDSCQNVVFNMIGVKENIVRKFWKNENFVPNVIFEKMVVCINRNIVTNKFWHENFEKPRIDF
jgi:hypothetical protein